MALALDGESGTDGTTSSSTTVTLTTTAAGVVYVLTAINALATVTTVTSANLTFTRRKASTGGNPTIELWSAYSSGARASEVITINYSASQFHSEMAWGVSGVPSSSYFDTNASLPAFSTTAPMTISTTTTDTFIVGGFRSSDQFPGAGTGFTRIHNFGANGYLLGEYKIVSSVQTNLSVVTANDPGQNGGIADAVVMAGAATTPITVTPPADSLAGGELL